MNLGTSGRKVRWGGAATFCSIVCPVSVIMKEENDGVVIISVPKVGFASGGLNTLFSSVVKIGRTSVYCI